jgi:hypothetical protein
MRPRDHAHIELIPQAQVLDDLAVVVDISALQVVEQTATPSDHLSESTATVVILLMSAEVIRQIVDARAEQRNLNAGRSTVSLMRPICLDGRTLFERHFPGNSPRQCAASLSVLYDSLVA